MNNIGFIDGSTTLVRTGSAVQFRAAAPQTKQNQWINALAALEDVLVMSRNNRVYPVARWENVGKTVQP